MAPGKQPNEGNQALAPGAELIPGYRLRELLGRGGFGEVWKADAPGGFQVALKFVALVRKEGAVEMRALEVIRTARHPNLLATFGAWQKAGFLIVAMELADRSLKDRLDEALAQGRPGIPAAEFFEYVREAAKGIDYLNEPHLVPGSKEPVRVQHRDIKPQNILLVGGSVKLADFGLARLMEHSITGHTGSLTAAYAAPEFFNKQTSASSDQYSLAVSYCELRGGRLPFDGTPVQVMAGHMLQEPDLTMLPAAERPAVARALSKDPRERWPNCRAFADALAASRPTTSPARTAPAPPAGRPTPSRTPRRTSRADSARTDNTPAAPPPRARTRPASTATPAEEQTRETRHGLSARPTTRGKRSGPGRIVLAGLLLATVPLVGLGLLVSGLPARLGWGRAADRSPGATPHLTLAVPDSLRVRAGERQQLTVGVRRAGFADPVRLVFSGLPPGITIRPVTVPADSDTVTVEVTADADAPAADRRVTVLGSSAPATDEVHLTLSLEGAAVAVAPVRRDEYPWTLMGQPRVVLVGISLYEDSQIRPRPHAEDDVKALYDLFTDPRYLGADAGHVRLLLGGADARRKSQPATRANILAALRWAADGAGSGDLVILAIVGRSGPLGGSGQGRVYFASDSTFKGRAVDALAAVEVGEALKALRGRLVVLLDAGPAVAEPAPGLAPYSEFLGEGADEHAPTGRVVFLPTNGLSTSLDLEDHGLFTQAVLAGLKGAADREGDEPDGLVTVAELRAHLDREVPDLAGTYGKTREEKKQQHYVLTGPSSHFPLVANPAVTARVKKRLDKLAELARAGEVSASEAAEGRWLLERMPRLRALRSLRKAYLQLVDGVLTANTFAGQRRTALDGMYLQRSDALAYARKVIEVTRVVKEQYVKDLNQGELVAGAIHGLYGHLDEKVPGGLVTRLGGARGLAEADLEELLADARAGLGKREDLEGRQDLNITLQRMLGRLDRLSTYIPPADKSENDRVTGGAFTGVGVETRKDGVTDQLLVVTPIKGSPAYKAGLMAGDLITTITREVDSDGKPLGTPEVIPTRGLPMRDCVKKLLGQAGTKVKLTVLRQGAARPLEYEITRGAVEQEAVLGFRRQADDEWDYLIDPGNRIAYVRLPGFTRPTERDLGRVMGDLTRQGIKGLVLDLRFNPGGLLGGAIKVADQYIDDGLIVTLRPRVGAETKYNGEHAGSLLDFPMVCLVNDVSASGSEIVAAALQDHKRALIVGERTYGLGSVQNLRDFEGGTLKLTTSSFRRPNGKNLDRSSTSGKDEDEWGVIPDKVVKLTPKEREGLAEHQRESQLIRRPDRPARDKEFKDRQLEAALEYLRARIGK